MDAATITAAGLQVLDDVGFEGLSMRAVAQHLGVQVGGLYYYVPNKAALLRAMADALCARSLAATPSFGNWREDAIAICAQVRQSLLEQRDGARLLVASPLVGSTNALRLMERLLAALAVGVAADRLGVAADALMSYLTGYVLQEQLARDAEFDVGNPELALDEFPYIAAHGDLGSSEETFDTAVRAIIAGFAGPS